MPQPSTLPPAYPTKPKFSSAERAQADAIRRQATNVKETIESILVAFILAFIFRAYVVEAFVIPTGSMAPTLMGAHTHFICPDCGYQFDVNYDSRGEGDNLTIPSETPPPNFPIHCPNCGYQITPNPTTMMPLQYGDRILVLKYLYLVHPQRRWDVVVFKSPAPPDPGQPRYSENFIKRLVGLPGETIQILDGNVYVSKDDGKNYTIATRPEKVQDALWRIVYNNDYHPQGMDRAPAQSPWRQPWTPEMDGPGWEMDSHPQLRTFNFDNLAGAATIDFDPNANNSDNAPSTHSFNDYLAYDQGHPHALATVSDLKLDLTYTRRAGDGPLRVRLSKYEDAFIAEIDPHEAKLLHQGAMGDQQIGQTVPIDSGVGVPVRIELSNVTYRVTLKIDDKTVVQSTPADYAPDLERLKQAYNVEERMAPPTVKIMADHQKCDIAHLSLWRDIYYVNQIDRAPAWGTPSNPVHLHRKGETRPDGSKYDDDEFFVLGDNSQLSSDARYWDMAIDLPNEGLEMESGRVPGRFFLGKAFFVYWPAGFRPFGPGSYSILPNFGDMRFIH
jgi:signal peptidase I